MERSPKFTEDEFEKMKKALRIYDWGLKTMLTKMEIMCEDLADYPGGNPVEHIKGRLKAPLSIADKLSRLKLDITAANACEHLTDIAGIRITCAYVNDIYSLVEILQSMPDITVLTAKDYVTNPKPSGYRSYHLIVEISVYYSGKTVKIPIEFQIRTGAMDFWATLEHKVRYKYKEQIPSHLCDELVNCANRINELDQRMFLIHDIISLINQER